MTYTERKDSPIKREILRHRHPGNGDNKTRRNKLRRTLRRDGPKRRNSNNKESFGTRRQRNEGSGPRTMPMEGRIPMAPRKDLGSQQRGNSDQPYTSTSRYSASRTRRNGKNDGAPTTQILLASYAQYDKTIRQELRHLPKNKGGTTCTLWLDEAK